MMRIARCAVVAGLLLPPWSFAGDEVDPAVAAAQRAWLAVDAVLDHHLAPPTRQQMLQAGRRAIWNSKGSDDDELDRERARNLSASAGRAETEEYLAAQLSEASRAGRFSLEQLATTLIRSAVQESPGGTIYTPARESAVEKHARSRPGHVPQSAPVRAPAGGTRQACPLG